MSKCLNVVFRRCWIRGAGARALDLRAYNPVAAVARDRRGAKLRNEQAADGVRRILTDTGLEPEFHGGVQQKGLEHRTRNAVTAISASDGLFCTVLFSLRILAKPSTTTLSVSCAAALTQTGGDGRALRPAGLGYSVVE